MSEADEDDDEPPEPWVRILAEHGWDGVWGRNSRLMWLEDLPISAALAARFRRWTAWFEQSDELVRRDPAFDFPAFAAEGLAIARAVKAELPGWTVIYFDEDRCRYDRSGQPREEFEYEVQPG